MKNLDLTANTEAEKRILGYLQNNASDTLADKINNGTPVVKDGQELTDKKTLSGFMKYAASEAKKLAEKGANSACVEDTVVFGWAIHYFEENSIEEKLFTPDRQEYKLASKHIPTQKAQRSLPEQAAQPSLLDMIEKQNKILSVMESDDDKSPKLIVTAENKSSFNSEYAALKRKYPDCVVAYRLGDFYEILGKDAVSLADKLNMTITSRDCGLEMRLPMIGYPYHAAKIYQSKIVSLGYTLVVAEPTGEPTVLSDDTDELTEAEMREFDGDVKEPRFINNGVYDDESDYTTENDYAKDSPFDEDAVRKLRDFLGDCFACV